MTLSKLQEAALTRFAKQGYTATSLAEIATDVGIKKPSIYAHFRNKDELYLSLLPQVISTELDYAKTHLSGGADIKKQLYNYLASIKTRYQKSSRVEFWMRALCSPPLHLYESVMPPMHQFMNDLEQLIKTALDHSPLQQNAHHLNSHTLAMAYMSMIDSLQSELIYGGEEKFNLRLLAIWSIFDIVTPSEVSMCKPNHKKAHVKSIGSLTKRPR